MVDPMCLPTVPKENIFTLLDGPTLHRSRAVSRTWNSYIMGEIWGVAANRRRLNERVEQHWMTGYKYTFENDEFLFPNMNGFIPVDGKSSKYVVIRSDFDIILEEARIKLFNVQEKTFWEINYPFVTVLHKALSDHYDINLSDSLLVVRVQNKSVLPTQTVMVWDIKNRMKIADEDMKHLKAVKVSETWTDSMLLVFFRTNAVEVWNCTDPYNITRTRITSNNFQFKSATYHHPFISMKLFYPKVEQGLKSIKEREEIKVWQYTQEDDGSETLNKIATARDLGKFGSLAAGAPLAKYEIKEIIFVGGVFVAACTVDLELGRNEDGERIIVKCSCVRILSSNGILLKQYLLPEADPSLEMNFHCFGTRLLLSIDNMVYIASQKFKPNGRGDSNSMKPLSFTQIPHLNGNEPIMMTMAQAFQPKLRVLFSGENMVRVKGLNFWKHIYSP